MRELSLRPRLRAGDAFRLALVTTTFEPRRGVSRVRPSTVTVNVLRATETGMLLAWSVDDAGTEFARRSELTPLERQLWNLRLECLLGPHGQFSGFRNHDELSDAMTKLLGSHCNHKPDALPIFTAEGLVAVLSHAPRTYFALNGPAIPAEGMRTTEASPTPFGGKVHGNRDWRIVANNSRSIDVSTETRFTPAAVASLLGVGQFAHQFPRFQLVETAQYAFDRQLGLARKIETTRTMKAGSILHQEETTVFYLLDEPHR